jgi:hypothetical protein
MHEPKPEEAEDAEQTKRKPIYSATEILQSPVAWDKIDLSTTPKKAYDSSSTNAIFGQFINTETWHLHLDRVKDQIAYIPQVFHRIRDTALLTSSIRSESDNVILALQSIMPPVVELLRLILPSYEFRLETEDSTQSIVVETGGMRKVKSRVDMTVYARLLPEGETEMEIEEMNNEDLQSEETEGWEPVLLLELKSPGILHRNDWE